MTLVKLGVEQHHCCASDKRSLFDIILSDIVNAFDKLDNEESLPCIFCDSNKHFTERVNWDKVTPAQISYFQDFISNILPVVFDEVVHFCTVHLPVIDDFLNHF